MQLCSKCKKRIAVVFISKFNGEKAENEGFCLKCAHQIGLPQVDQMMKQFGISDEELDQLAPDLDGMEFPVLPNEGQEDDDGKAPPINFMKLFGAGNMPAEANDASEGDGAAKPKGTKSGKKKKFLGLYCTDLNQRVRDGKIDNIIGRERELSRVMQILCRRQKNNPCLIGEPGVGKTAVAEALAEKIVKGDVPYRLKDKEVYLVDMTALVAGTQFRGQFETRMKGLIDEVKALGNIILVIDEVHTIASAGDAEGSMNAANILKPALSRGEIQVIGATTLTEYRKFIEKDAALERRFQPVMIDEPSIDECAEILRGIKIYYEDFHKIVIPEEVILRTVILSERYITDRYLPDKAIDLLDEALSYVALNSDIIDNYNKAEGELNELNVKIAEIEAREESEPEKQQEKYKELAEYKVKQINAKAKLEHFTEEKKKVTLKNSDLARVIELWTGIPATSIIENDYSKISRLEDAIKSRLIGQDHAVDSVVRAIKRNRAGVSYKRKPVSFIFAGPTGVGKTELVKLLAKELFDSPETLIRLDMSEFMEKFSVSRIIGAPPGYVGYDEAGQLTEKIRRKPYSVVLFDEIEKAHPDVMNILLQILDDGRVTDAQGRTVNFENTVLVMTTNAGSELSSSTAGFGAAQEKLQESRTEKALSGFLRPEFINRVDEIITFRHLTKDNFKKIAVIMLSDLKTALSEKEISFAWTEQAAEFIAENSFSEKYGARNMRRFIQTSVEDKIADKLFECGGKVSGISLEMSGEALAVAVL